ncbi:MAG: ABC transporter substrate-binding protein [Proteobacteria bacterium]|nr:ABC transporter substrate-binding protein [Pseudomonadota bacterium]
MPGKPTLRSGPISRRKLLRSAAAGGAAISATAIGSKIFAPAVAQAPAKVRIAWTEVAACHAPLGFGVDKGFYKKHGVDVELFYQGASGQTLIQALATNKADIGAGLVLDWLKPLEQGFDVKLFVGSHGGCQRLLASEASGITDIKQVAGKRIASYDVASPPKIAFQVTLARNGIDPEQGVEWVTVPFDIVGEAVKRGDADLAAHLDPWAYSIQKQFGLKLIADTQTGIYQDAVCCVLGANGPFLKDNPDAVRRVAQANLEIHEYTANHPDEVADWYLKALNPGLPRADLVEILAGIVYHNHPVGEPLIKEIKRAADDLKLTKVLDAATDADEFARRVTIDILA